MARLVELISQENTLVITVLTLHAVDGTPPDGTPRIVINMGSQVVLIVRVILTSITAVVIIVCLGFNIIFRNKK